MLKKNWFVFLLLVIEGSSLMAIEITGAKVLAPFYGSSLYVWTAILSLTILGLTLGYYFGGLLAKKNTTEKQLVIILGFAAVLVFLFPFTAKFLISITSAMPLIPGIIISVLFLEIPPMMCFGLIGPMTVKLLTEKLSRVGNVAGIVYFTSTLGGILATFLFGFYWIPELGITYCTRIVSFSLISLPVIYLTRFIIFGKGSELHRAEVSETPHTIPEKTAVKRQGMEETLQIKKSIYLYAAIEGATVMAVELISARMLAPWFGSGLFVWVAAIGITLLSLALGYFIGGKLAVRYTSISVIHWVLLAASVFLMLMHFISQQLTYILAGIDMRIALVLTSLLFILPPLIFLGMIPTLLIRLLTLRAETSGTTTGRVFSISSFSGILALPLLGFFIIPRYGLTLPSILIGFLVGIIPFINLVKQKKYLSLLFIIFILFSFSKRDMFASSPDVRKLVFSEGILGQVLVADVIKNDRGIRINERILFVNRMGQTVNDITTNQTKWNYVIFASAAASRLPEHSKALLLGLGGGALANNLVHNLKINVDGVELDRRIGRIAKKYFDLDPAVNVIIDDARHYLETTHQTYDLIIFDVFRGDVQPAHLLSLECFQKAKSLLSRDGMIIINFNGFITGEIGRPARSVYATLKASGLQVKILPTPGKEEERNLLFLASGKNMEFSQLRSPLLHFGKAVELDSLFLSANSLNLKDAVIFTDDKTNLDRLSIRANNIWKSGYNNTYTSFLKKTGIPLFN